MRRAAPWFALFSLIWMVASGCGEPISAEPQAAKSTVADEGGSVSNEETKPVAEAKPAADLQLAAAPAASPAKPSSAAAGQETDWPCFLGPTHDSKSTETGIIAPWPEQGPAIVWQAELGTGYDAPTISQGRLFQFDRDVNSARVRALDARTGKLIWKFDYPSQYEDLYGYDNGPRCSPVVDGDRVYCLGVEGMLHCLAAADGKVIWKVNTAAEFGVIQNFFGVGSTPLVEGDLLITMIGGSPPESQNVPPGQLDRIVGNGSGVVAFDKLTGKVKYKISDELASYASPIPATIDNRRWCFAFARGGLLAFNPLSGEVDFHYPWRAPIMESVNASCPVVVGNHVFISETYGPGCTLLKVRPGGYDVVYADPLRSRQKIMQTHWNTPVYHDGFLYASSGRHETNAELRCIEFLTGKVRWSEPDLTRSSLLYADGYLICLSEEGTLRLLKANPEKYEVVSEVVLEDKSQGPNPLGFKSRLLRPPAWAAPILSHGLLYVRGRDRLVCLQAK